MQQNLVSIVLPTYNGEKYIRYSIESVLNQTYKNWELIIVNDFSNDNTFSIINEYAKTDERIKIINNNINKKLPASLNIGFTHATGDYYTWTSDDNLYKEEAIEKMVNSLCEKNIDIVYCDFYCLNSSGENTGQMNLNSKLYFVSGNPIGSCFLYKKQVHEKLNGYDESLFKIEDYDFWIRASTIFKYYFINEPLYFHRVHIDSLTNTNKDEIYNDLYYKVLNNNVKNLKWISKEQKKLLHNKLYNYYRKTNIIKCITNYIKYKFY